MNYTECVCQCKTGVGRRELWVNPLREGGFEEALVD